jgi:hypothetical protein
MLLTFTAIGKDVFPQVMENILDISQKYGHGIQEVTIQVGKAIQDPAQGIMALHRIGVNFSKVQQEMLKGWVAHGETLKAQKFIIAELNTEFGGIARLGETLPGKLARLNNMFDIIKETIGNAMMPAVINLVTGLVPLVKALGEWLPGALDTAGKGMASFFGSMSKLTSGMNGQMMPAMANMSKGFQTTLGPAIQQVGGWIMSTLMPAIISMQVWFATKVMPIILAVAGIIMTDFMPTIEMLAGRILTKLLPPLQRIAADVLPALIPLFKLLGWVFGNIVGPVLQGVIDLLGYLLDAISWVIDKGIE